MLSSDGCWFSFPNIILRNKLDSMTHYLGSAHPVLSASDQMGAGNSCAVADEDEEGFLNTAGLGVASVHHDE